MIRALSTRPRVEILFEGTDIGAVPARHSRLHLCAPASRWSSRIQPRASTPAILLSAPSPIRFTLHAGLGRDEVRARCEALASSVGLPRELLERFPHQLSGGQKARVGIGRAIALSPKLVILDEPTAALDVSVQAVVLNLLQDLKERLGMSYLFVSHDLNVVRLLCDRVIVMRGGRIAEQGPTARVLEAPRTPTLVSFSKPFQNLRFERGRR